MSLELVLERRQQDDGTTTIPIGPSAAVSLPPALGEDYWSYRVRLTPTQSVVGFPKFDTIGIGFAVEDDTNTNLPYTCATIDIVSHIWHNHPAGNPAHFDDREAYDPAEDIAIVDVYDAVALIQAAVGEDRPAAAAPNSRPSNGASWRVKLADYAGPRA